MSTLTVYIGTENEYPDIAFDVIYPEVKFHFTTYQDNFEKIAKHAKNILTQSSDFLKFLSVSRIDRDIVYHINGKISHNNDDVRMQLLEFYESMMILAIINDNQQDGFFNK